MAKEKKPTNPPLTEGEARKVAGGGAHSVHYPCTHYLCPCKCNHAPCNCTCIEHTHTL